MLQTAKEYRAITLQRLGILSLVENRNTKKEKANLIQKADQFYAKIQKKREKDLTMATKYNENEYGYPKVNINPYNQIIESWRKSNINAKSF